MKKQEFDTMESVYSSKQIPNKKDPDSPENVEWWKKVHHDTDVEAKNPDMYRHEIAFAGTLPVVLKEIYRGKEKTFTNTFFTSSYKRRT